MALSDPALQELADLCGLSTEYWDWHGVLTPVAPETVIAVLGAMEVDARTPDAIQASIRAQRERPWRRTLPPATVVRAGHAGLVNVHVGAGQATRLTIQLEDGGTRTATQVDNWERDRQIDGALVGEATFQLPDDLPSGYHRLVCTAGDRTDEAALLVTPDWLGLPAHLGRRRVWGYQVQLYSVRSSGSWGVGDLADLTDLATWSATQQQADYVLVNPLHAASPIPPMEPSPYLPSSRRFVNPLYIRPEAIPEFARLGDAGRMRVAQLRENLATHLAGTDRIDRDAAWAAKRTALRLVFDTGLPAGRQMAFDAYRRAQGRGLRDFAAWTVLCGAFGGDWRDWDERYQRPTSPEVDAFVDTHRDDVRFVEWQQWIAQDQLSAAQRAAQDAGMRVGVVTDLAVGVKQDSADRWMLADVYAHGVFVGVPPDAYNQLGQDWTQPPWRPDRLADLGYVPFRDMVRAALSHAGGLRIDHILGMFRLWWVPAGNTPDKGCYVRYDHEALIGIIALEAQRAGALVVGEDLGTVEPWVRDYLAGRGILGTSVLWFECFPDGSVKRPAQWREWCMASVTTHDLPPSAGYLALDHVRLRHDLGLLTVPLDAELERAHAAQADWLAWLDETGTIRPDLDGQVLDPVEAQVLALHRALLGAPSRVLNVALVDAVGERRIQNQPGTIDEYPNWRVPLGGVDGTPLLLDDIMTTERPMRLAAVMNGWTHVPEPWRPAL
ncbi:MAG: 4-alpha-glucanotransferase [Actinomycetia bacterium]|nr:4-alpha-glucanotransferase [Actinomycetes bacterium]